MSLPPRDERDTGHSGDLDAPDIVGPTGEEMPVATHDEVGDDRRHDRPTPESLSRPRPTSGTARPSGVPADRPEAGTNSAPHV